MFQPSPGEGAFNFGQLAELAARRRSQRYADEESNLAQLTSQHPEMFSNVFEGGTAGAINRMHQNQAAESAQARFNPQWDAWFEGLQQAGEPESTPRPRRLALKGLEQAMSGY